MYPMLWGIYLRRLAAEGSHIVNKNKIFFFSKGQLRFFRQLSDPFKETVQGN